MNEVRFELFAPQYGRTSRLFEVSLSFIYVPCFLTTTLQYAFALGDRIINSANLFLFQILENIKKIINCMCTLNIIVMNELLNVEL